MIVGAVLFAICSCTCWGEIITRWTEVTQESTTAEKWTASATAADAQSSQLTFMTFLVAHKKWNTEHLISYTVYSSHICGKLTILWLLLAELRARSRQRIRGMSATFCSSNTQYTPQTRLNSTVTSRRRRRGLGPDRYMTISVHTTSVERIDHFGTTTSVQCYIGTLNLASLRDRLTVGHGNRRRLIAMTYLLCE